jgi:hypothetical protein
MRDSVIIFKDGFAWKNVSNKARQLLKNNVLTIYAVDPYQEIEWVVDTEEELDSAIVSGYAICIEVGYIDKARFITRRIDDDKVLIDGSIYTKLRI